jgi:chromosome segregation ATPase
MPERTPPNDLAARLVQAEARADKAEAERDVLREHILDIDAHATPYEDLPDDPGYVGLYLLTSGALHRALGKVGRSASPCKDAVKVTELLEKLEEAERAHRQVEAERDHAEGQLSALRAHETRWQAEHAEVERLRAELADARRIISAKPDPDSIEDLRERITELLGAENESVLEAFLSFATAEIGRIACGEMSALWWTQDELTTVKAERDALKAAIAALLTAQGRMVDGWAEGNEDRRRELWRRLHREADRVRDALDGAHSPAGASAVTS